LARFAPSIRCRIRKISASLIVPFNPAEQFKQRIEFYNWDSDNDQLLSLYELKRRGLGVVQSLKNEYLARDFDVSRPWLNRVLEGTSRGNDRALQLDRPSSRHDPPRLIAVAVTHRIDRALVPHAAEELAHLVFQGLLQDQPRAGDPEAREPVGAGCGERE
jgi:hypothetical protein